VALSAAHLEETAYATVAAREFDFATPENELKWEMTEPRRGQFDFTRADRVVRFAESHAMKLKGHTLVWHKQLPSWMKELTQPGEIRAAMTEHITQLVSYYRGRVLAWDVVNEALSETEGYGLRDSVFRRLGDEYLDEAFTLAHEADPDALLIYNDFGIEGTEGKGESAYQLVKGLCQRGVPIHGVGLQTHTHVAGAPTGSSLKAQTARFAELGLIVYVSELDVSVCSVAGDQANKWAAQSQRYHELLTACVSEPAFAGVTFWGVTDKYSWLNRHEPCTADPFGAPWPLLFDDQYRAKPAWQAVRDALIGGQVGSRSGEQISADLDPTAKPG
jgi:endo-1,4-beta-xylanase